MSYADQDMFFAQAYHTGTDIWSEIPFKHHTQDFIHFIPKGSTVLDVGAGRGRIIREFASIGFRAVGLENNEHLVVENNTQLENDGLLDSARFVAGSALAMPFTEYSFDAVLDFGLMQHMKPEDFKHYVSEISKILKTGGILFLYTLSKETKSYLKLSPATDTISDYQIENVHYHFFTEAEISSYFEGFDILKTSKETPFLNSDTVFIATLLKKR